MNEMYKSTVKAVNAYMYPKQYVVLNASVVVEDPTTETVVEESTSTSETVVETPTPEPAVEESVPASVELDESVVVEDPTTETVVEEITPVVVELDASEVLKEINPNEMKKSELIDYVKMLHGDDADVSGTKAEILERYFS